MEPVKVQILMLQWVQMLRGPKKTLGTIALQHDAATSLHTQLASQLKSRIQHGELSAGQRLPSSRDLCALLRISRNTVIAAYDALLTEGYVEARERSGMFVGRAANAFRQNSHAGLHASKPGAQFRPDPVTRFRAPVPFRPSQPDVRLFPIRIWNRERARLLRRGTAILNYQSVFSSGFDGLRKILADYLRDSRGVRCDWREIAITSGSQQALFLLASLLVSPGDRVYLEDPGYLGARLALRQAGARISPLPVDNEGICLPPSDQRPVSLLYVTPSRQFPMGYCMSLARRLELLQFAVRKRTWIIEDDYDAEFRYSSPPLPSLQHLDDRRRVIYVGTFSKVLFPSLRIGYVVLPPRLVDRFNKLKHVAEDHGPLIDQATLASFIESGAFHTHLRRCRRAYAERREVFLKCVSRFGLPFRFPDTDGGMNLAALVPDHWNDEFVSERFRAANLDIPPLSRYSISQKTNGFLFGFTAFDPPAIEHAVKNVATTLHADSQHLPACN
jgi:GntR family transcriptional regulator/MocR family aminotransferase